MYLFLNTAQIFTLYNTNVLILKITYVIIQANLKQSRVMQKIELNTRIITSTLEMLPEPKPGEFMVEHVNAKSILAVLASALTNTAPELAELILSKIGVTPHPAFAEPDWSMCQLAVKKAKLAELQERLKEDALPGTMAALLKERRQAQSSLLALEIERSECRQTSSI